MAKPELILKFWLDDVGPARWYAQNSALDATIRERFLGAWEEALQGRFALWLTFPKGALAYCILLDQLSRNMFRGNAKAFSADKFALAAAKSSIHQKWDLRIDEPARQFFYLPLMHSENLPDQDRCVRLIKTRLQLSADEHLTHAKAHRDVIRTFGRFPSRNLALGRTHTTPERQFIQTSEPVTTVYPLQAVG
jgi:uncharacterized protein (DUF924 family)